MRAWLGLGSRASHFLFIYFIAIAILKLRWFYVQFGRPLNRCREKWNEIIAQYNACADRYKDIASTAAALQHRHWGTGDGKGTAHDTAGNRFCAGYFIEFLLLFSLLWRHSARAVRCGVAYDRVGASIGVDSRLVVTSFRHDAWILECELNGTRNTRPGG